MRKFFKPVQPRELYTQQALERVFPGGEWIHEAPSTSDAEPIDRRPGTHGDNGGSPAPVREGIPGDDRLKSAGSTPAPSPPSITIIGGTKYDEDALSYFFHQHPDYEVVTGAGRGVESDLSAQVRIQPDKDRFGKLARKVNVEQVLCHDMDSPVLLVGSGERVKQARDWLKRTGSKREVVELP